MTSGGSVRTGCAPPSPASGQPLTAPQVSAGGPADFVQTFTRAYRENESCALAGAWLARGACRVDPSGAPGECPAAQATGHGSQGIPEATIARLPVYLRVLYACAEQGIATVSSEELAAAAGVNSAKLRKDLSHLGSYGTRGVGYDVDYLVYQVSRELGLTQDWPVVIVGAGNLGRALANYGGFASRGFRIAAVLDSDPGVVGVRDRRACGRGRRSDRAGGSPSSCVDRRDRDPGRSGAGGLRPAGRRRCHQHPEFRACGA